MGLLILRMTGLHGRLLSSFDGSFSCRNLLPGQQSEVCGWLWLHMRLRMVAQMAGIGRSSCSQLSLTVPVQRSWVLTNSVHHMLHTSEVAFCVVGKQMPVAHRLCIYSVVHLQHLVLHHSAHVMSNVFMATSKIHSQPLQTSCNTSAGAQST